MREKAVTDAKTALRSSVRSARRSGFECGDAHSDALIELISRHEFKTIAAFEEFDNEPSLSKLRDWCAAHSIRLLLPVIADATRLSWTNGELSDAQLIVVPALAAGLDGSRLGRGKGYYDRALASATAPRIVAVHDSEVFDSVPSERHDELMDAICSCSGISCITARLK
jgi:5-formyltetrahydrofolate cyclo-ligase